MLFARNSYARTHTSSVLHMTMPPNVVASPPRSIKPHPNPTRVTYICNSIRLVWYIHTYARECCFGDLSFGLTSGINRAGAVPAARCMGRDNAQSRAGIRVCSINVVRTCGRSVGENHQMHVYRPEPSSASTSNAHNNIMCRWCALLKLVTVY